MKLVVFAALAAAVVLATPAHAACDLTPTIGARAEARAGETIMTTLEVANRGDTNCPGTIEIPPAGYFVDIFLSTDRNPPPGFAVYHPTWREDVLLLGGRVSRTFSIGPGVTARYGAPSYEIGPFTLPGGIPPGDYFICAGVDLGRRVAESNDANNTACNPLRIRPPASRIDPKKGLPRPSVPKP